MLLCSSREGADVDGDLVLVVNLTRDSVCQFVTWYWWYGVGRNVMELILNRNPIIKVRY